MTRRSKRLSPFRKLRILVLVAHDLIPPDSLSGKSEQEVQRYRTEYDVISTLRDMGHEVFPIGLYDDLAPVRSAINDHKPHIAFNLLEEFAGSSVLATNVVGLLELLQLPYTGCNPRGQMIAQDKALSKKILAYHRIHVPQFAVFPRQSRIRRLHKLKYPLLVKSLVEEGSVGISQASVVYDDDALIERVQLIHRTIKSHAIVEEYIEGRELYVGVMGSRRLQTLPVWELLIENLPEGAPNIATLKVKWDLKYQKKVGVVTKEAEGLSKDQREQIRKLVKRIYKLLDLSGYARLDFRLRPDGRLFLLEANPNPNIAKAEDFAASAKSLGISYEELLQRLLNIGLIYENGSAT